MRTSPPSERAPRSPSRARNNNRYELSRAPSGWTRQRRQTGQGGNPSRPRSCTKAILDEGGSTIVREGNRRKWRVTCRLIIYCITSHVTIEDCSSFTTASCLSAAALPLTTAASDRNYPSSRRPAPPVIPSAFRRILEQHSASLPFHFHPPLPQNPLP